MPDIREPPCRRLPSWALGIAASVTVAIGLNIGLSQALAAAESGESSNPASLNGAGLEQFPRDHLFRILGKDVLSATGEQMGRIVDVLFDRSGKPCAAVIDFGGFLGVGTRKIAIDWGALRFDLGEKKNVIALDLGREQLKVAPEYKESDKPIAVLTPSPGGANEDSAGASR